MHKKLLLGLIGTIIAGHAFAETTTQTIPTQSYVDTNFQTKIPAGTHGANNTVVTYGANAGQPQERWILGEGTIDMEDQEFGLAFYKGVLNKFDLNTGHLTGNSFGEFDDDEATAVTRDQAENALVTAKILASALAYKQPRMTCKQWLDNAAHTDENCLLWQLNN